MPTEAELKEGLSPEEELERSEKYFEAKAQALSDYTGMWRDFIEAKLAEGMTPEEIRDPGKLRYPKDHDNYEEISSAFHKYFGPGDEFGVVDRAIEEVILKRERETLEERGAREVIESLKETPTGKYMGGESIPTEAELKEKLSPEKETSSS